MGEYTIATTFTAQQIADINKDNLKLCFTSGVGSDPAHNVIAWSGSIAPKVTISWIAKYLIAASKDQFSEGVKFEFSTTPSPIDFQEVYTLPPLWTDGVISPDPKLNPGSFSFSNETADGASAVVSKLVNGKPTPFYISTSPVFPHGTETMTPKLIVALWFQKDAETGTMVSTSTTSPSTFDMTGTHSINLTWNGSAFIQSP